jgi:hypothetical protein
MARPAVPAIAHYSIRTIVPITGMTLKSCHQPDRSRRCPAPTEGKGREGKGREGKGREGKGREGKGREGKGREGKGREGKIASSTN